MNKANERAKEIAIKLGMKLDNKLDDIKKKGTPFKGFYIAILLFILASVPWIFLTIISACKCVKEIILG